MPINQFPTEEFTLPNSKMKVVMRTPLLKDQLEAIRQPDVKNDEDVVVCTMSKVSTFDGNNMNWDDLAGSLTISDYKVMIKHYRKLTNADEEEKGEVEGNGTGQSK